MYDAKRKEGWHGGMMLMDKKEQMKAPDKHV
jgi:hypothetical protein